jgi:YVTN family beta-propeller protein
VAADRTASTADPGHGSAPTGTVTFLFSDIEGSTRLVRRLGNEYGSLLEQHHRLLRAAFGGHGGHEVDSQGDAFFFAFRRARDAVVAAVAGQRSLLDAGWPEEVAVRVRIGIHTGEPGLVAAGYHGVDVVRAARIAAVAHGGQIVVSSATRDVIGDDALPEVSFLDLGEHRLKDFERAHRLFQVSAPGLPHEFPALRTARAEGALDIGGREEDLAAAAGAAVAAERRGGRLGRGRLVAGLAALALAAAAVLAGLAFTRQDDPTPTVVPNSVVSIDPDTNQITGVVAVGRSPDAVTTSGNAVWVASRSDDTLTRVDARSGRTRTLGGFPFPTSLDREGARIWVGNNTGGNLVAIDSESGGEVDRVRLPAAAASFVAHGAGSLWVSEEEGAVFRVSLSTRKVRGRWPESPHGIAYGHGAAWVANAGPGELLRIDASDGTLQRIGSGSLPEDVAVGFGAVWVTCSGDDEVRRFNPVTGAVEKIIPVGSEPAGITTGAGAVWVTNRGDGTVSRIDPKTNQVVATIRTGFFPAGVHVGAGGVWVTVAPASS